MARGQYMIDEDCPSDPHHEHVQAPTTLVSEERANNQEEEEKEEQVEKFEPPQNSIQPNDKEVSTEAHSFVTIPLETQFELQVLPFQCLEEPSYEEIFKDSRTQNHKSKNQGPKRIFRKALLGYIRWRNILQEGNIVFMKKG
jgi:hypothetical protein